MRATTATNPGTTRAHRVDALLARRGVSVLSRTLFGALVVVALLGALPNSARADSGGAAVVYLFLGVVASPFVNLAAVAAHEQPSWEWIAGGVLSGGLLIGVAAWGLSDDFMSVPAGIGLVVWGLVCFGLAVAAGAQPPPPPRDTRRWLTLLEWR